MPANQPLNTSSDRPPLPPCVSPVLYELTDFVDNKFNQLPQDVRHLILCIAYTQYCKRKKDFITNQVREDNTNTKRLIALSFKPFAYIKYYESLSDEAYRNLQLICDATYKKMLDETTTSIEDKINRAIVPIESLKSSLEPLSMVSAQLATYITTRPPPPRPTPKQVAIQYAIKALSFIVIDSFKHFALTFIMIFGWALGILYSIDHFVPSVRKAIGTIVTHETGFFGPNEPVGKEEENSGRVHGAPSQ